MLGGDGGGKAGEGGWENGAGPLRVRPLFLLLAKEKAVLDSEKEKVDQWK